MKKFTKAILCAATAAALAFGSQIISFAALDTDISALDEVSVSSDVSTPPEAGATSDASLDENILPHQDAAQTNELTQNAAERVNEIPDTGVENIAIPSIVALIAAATAAVALTGKKK